MTKHSNHKEKEMEKYTEKIKRTIQYDAMEKITDRKTDKARERFLRPAYMGQFGGFYENVDDKG